MGKNLAYRCSDAVYASVQSSRAYMIGTDPRERVAALT